MASSKGPHTHSVCSLSAYRSPSMTNWPYFGWHMALEQMAEQTQFSLASQTNRDGHQRPSVYTPEQRHPCVCQTESHTALWPESS